MTIAEFIAVLDHNASVVHHEMEHRLTAVGAPDRLRAAMRHAVLGGGKRIRPFLVIESARLFGVEGKAPLAVGAALECVHCYSLVHDDLPAMDNDDMRRGKPTVHRAFDEATAILAGDALLTLAFEIMADRQSGLAPGRALRLIGALGKAAGARGMVGGQMLDLAAEGRFQQPGERRRRLGRAAIRQLQSMKTGALIRFAVEAGAMMTPRATVAEKRALKVYGDCLGLAFQLRDDLLDLEGSAEVVGKAVAKDVGAGKATFATLLGTEGARQMLAETCDKAKLALADGFGDRARALSELIDFNAVRQK